MEHPFLWTYFDPFLSHATLRSKICMVPCPVPKTHSHGFCHEGSNCWPAMLHETRIPGSLLATVCSIPSCYQRENRTWASKCFLQWRLLCWSCKFPPKYLCRVGLVTTAFYTKNVLDRRIITNTINWDRRRGKLHTFKISSTGRACLLLPSSLSFCHSSWHSEIWLLSDKLHRNCPKQDHRWSPRFQIQVSILFWYSLIFWLPETVNHFLLLESYDLLFCSSILSWFSSYKSWLYMQYLYSYSCL